MRIRILAAFAVLYFVWGSTFLAIRFTLNTVPPFLGAGVRFVLAGLIVYGWLRHRGAKPPTADQWRKASIAGSLMILVGYGAVFWAQQTVKHQSRSNSACISGPIQSFTSAVGWSQPTPGHPGATDFTMMKNSRKWKST